MFLFRENAADLYPRKVARQPRETLLKSNPKMRPKQKRKTPPNLGRPTPPDEKLEPEDFPSQMYSLAADVMTFLNCLNEFPEFTDEAVNASIQSFDGDLKVSVSPIIRAANADARPVLGIVP